MNFNAEVEKARQANYNNLFKVMCCHYINAHQQDIIMDMITCRMHAEVSNEIENLKKQGLIDNMYMPV